MGSWRRFDRIFVSAAAFQLPITRVPEERDQLVGRGQVLAQDSQINFDWHCSWPSHYVAKARCCLARSGKCARTFDAEK